MKTISFFRVAIVSLLVMLVSCQKESDIDLSIGDLVGTWETEEFEEPPLYGPITVEIKGDYTMEMSYLIDNGDGNPFTFIENCEFTIDGNKINYESIAGYSATIVVKEFTGPTMKFSMSKEGLNLTLNAKKIK